jgi:hypothetical protein
MGMTWWDIAQPLAGGLVGVVGVYLMEDVLRMLRNRGLCPERWNRDR